MTASDQTLEALRLAMNALVNIDQYGYVAFDWPESEWAKHTPGTCEECKRWRDMNHPIQHSCDGWYRLYYERQKRQRDQECTQHYEMRLISREALDAIRKILPASNPSPAAPGGDE